MPVALWVLAMKLDPLPVPKKLPAVDVPLSEATFPLNVAAPPSAIIKRSTPPCANRSDTLAPIYIPVSPSFVKRIDGEETKPLGSKRPPLAVSEPLNVAAPAPLMVKGVIEPTPVA